MYMLLPLNITSLTYIGVLHFLIKVSLHCMHAAHCMKNIAIAFDRGVVFRDNLLRSHGVLLNAKCYLFSR